MLKTAFVFPGQGSQYVGMGKELAENFSSAKKVFSTASELLGYDLQDICFNGPEDKLRETVVTQPAVLTTSIACLEVLKEYGITADVVAGLSLGEYSALVAADSIKFEDAIPLVEKRGKFMQEAVPLGKGSMAAVIGLNKDQIIEVCQKASEDGIVEPANFNCPGQIVIAGETSAVKKALTLAKEKGARKVVELPVSAPFHTSLLKPAGEKLAVELNKTELNDANIPVISNVNADYVYKASDIKNSLIKQVSSSVLWEDTIRKMIEDGVELFIEIGPGKTLSGFIKKIDKKIKVLNLEDLKSLKKIQCYIREENQWEN
ncbi:MAG: [acyl-carrier-protein] S-malonyltransferase [Thermosediminibacterales bacterium]|nr:[acyl-carrier-protein] S-malonyltransferase [Thermosediminibacterales bacterium]MDK2835455.1 [acyl-carrier-protein] S-malonyltransferase [Thermosediminibacterales bacterium]